ncbi:MAG: hypothetical protein B7733_15040 [Myxococcales bacterium FL481]|nr:MAG: hypothetical protein B7733_15040 [Myxococcales bacterium FL481]
MRIALRRPTAGGAWFVVVAARQLVVRLAALVPPPRFDMVRYRGVLAGRHHLPHRVVERGVHGS